MSARFKPPPGRILTWFGAFVHGAVVNLVFELGSVVVHVDDEDVQVDGVFHLVPVHVHGVGAELRHERRRRTFLETLGRRSEAAARHTSRLKMK